LSSRFFLETEFKAMKQRLKLPPVPPPNGEVIYGGKEVN
jgi:hypothetical protein